MKRLFYLFLILLTFYNIYLCSLLVRNGEVNLFNDVARDFLLFQEVDQKKIVLIGPRSSTNNLFHGPLWTYINYPAYLMGNGNPVVVAWFWLFLECVFLLTGLFMIKKLLGTLPALAFVLITSIRFAPHIDGVFHAEATIFFIPLFFFTICMYIKSKKILFLALHFLALAILTELEIGIGMQLIILSTIIIGGFIFKYKLFRHLASFFLLPLFLLNYIVFDLRHGLRMFTAIFSTGKSTHFFIPISLWLENRIHNTVSLQLIENSPITPFTYIIFALVVLFTILKMKNEKNQRHIYFLFVFYYFGYMLMSFFNKGVILYHYIYLLIPLTTLWFVSFLSGKYKILFLPLVGIIFVLNLQSVTSEITHRQRDIMGNTPNSWRALSVVAKAVVEEQKGKEFGYFVFSPDSLAYQPRYAMIYNFKASHAKAFEYVKKPTTYVIANPPPGNDPYMTHVWWRINQVNISSQPIETKKFPGGFTIEKFNLSPQEQKIPYDKNIELRIHFR